MSLILPRLFCRIGIAVLIAISATLSSSQLRAEDPIKALLITGGCCHNYPFQSEAMQKGIAKHANVTWKVVNEGGKGTEAEIEFYDDPNWAKGFDVVVHNECFANTKNTDYIKKITQVHHEGVPALVIHCAMHTYRASKTDEWRQFLGVTSRRHDHQSNYAVKKVVADHPIMKAIPDNWVTAKDELYIIEKLWPTATALATSVSERDGKAHPVIWTNQYGKARVFGTTYGHSDATFADPIFTDLLAHGLLWASDKLPK
jgi:type 1 glutamine amidotransferase